MDFLTGLVQSLAYGMVTQAGSSLVSWVTDYFKSKAKDMKSAEVIKLLAQLGAASAADVKQLVEKTFGKDERLSDAQR